MQLHGGIGFTWEHECHLFLKRARLNQVLGANTVLRDRSAAMLRRGQAVGYAEVDEARLLATEDDLDGESQSLARFGEELRCILRHAKRVRSDRAHGIRLEAT